MSLFKNHFAAQGRLNAEAESVEDAASKTVIEPGQDGKPGNEADNIDPTLDAFAEQRAQRNREHQMIRGGFTSEADEGGEGGEGEIPDVGGEAGEDDETIDIDVVDDGSDEAEEIEELENQMRMLSDSAIAIESFGLNPTALAIMQTTGLLNDTALSSLGLESVGFTAGADDESQMALESLGEKIKATAASWGEKILNFAKSIGSKIMGALEPIWNRITGVVKNITAAGIEKARAAGRTIKAHPYATAAAAAAAIGAVVTIVAFVAGGAPAASADPTAIAKFLEKIKTMATGIKWPFGNVTATISEAGASGLGRLKLGFTRIGSKIVADKNSALGWSFSAVKNIQAQLVRSWNGLRTAVTSLPTRAKNLYTGASDLVEGVGKDMGAKAHKAVYGHMRAGGATATHAQKYAKVARSVSKYATVSALISGYTALVGLVVKVIGSCLSGIYSTFRALVGSGGSSEAAAA